MESLGSGHRTSTACRIRKICFREHNYESAFKSHSIVEGVISLNVLASPAQPEVYISFLLILEVSSMGCDRVRGRVVSVCAKQSVLVFTN